MLRLSYFATIKDTESEVLLWDIYSVKSNLQVSAEKLPREIQVVRPLSTAPLVQDLTYLNRKYNRMLKVHLKMTGELCWIVCDVAFYELRM